VATLRPVVVSAGNEVIIGSGQTEGAIRAGGVTADNTPATRLWFGRVSNEPGYRSLPHHHGEAETGGFVLRGHARIYFGDAFGEFLDMYEGDWVFVPPHLPHVEANISTDAELLWMTTRTPGNIVVNLADVADTSLPGFRRI
jgi:uncharacterized RmlC-like cupin family protein